MSDVQKAQLEFSNWEKSIKSTDAALRDTALHSKQPALRKKDSAVSIRGSNTNNLASIHEEESNGVENDGNNSSTGSVSSASSGSDSSDSENDNQEAARTRRPRSILKTPNNESTSTMSSSVEKSRHVRFQDEVEAAARELERIKRKQERRQRQVEMHLAHPVVDTGKGKHKKKKGSTRKISGEKETPVSSSPNAAEVKEAVKVGKVATNESSRIKSYDYRSWDKFNVEAELEKLESDNQQQPATAARITPVLEAKEDIIPSIESSAVDQEDALVVSRLAESEKEKGNESFKAKEYQDALRYYTRSLQIKPQVQVYNNRCLVHIKLAQYEKAEFDATAAINLAKTTTDTSAPTDTFKSHLRRALSRSKRGNYIQSLHDLTHCLHLFPENQEAKDLQKEVLLKFRDGEGDSADLILAENGLMQHVVGTCQPIRKSSGGIKIIEVDSVKDDDANADEADEREVDEEEEVEDEIVTPFGKSCGGVGITTTPKPSSARKEAPAAVPKKAWKGKERALVPDNESQAAPQLTEEEILEKEAQRRTAIMDAWKENVEGELKKRPGYASASGVGREERVETVGTILPPKIKREGDKIEIVEVDFDSDEEEDNVDTPATATPTSLPNPTETIATDAPVVPQSDAVQTTPKATEVCQKQVKLDHPAPTTSYEFESSWKSLKSAPEEWNLYLRKVAPKMFPKLLANVGNPSIILDVFRGLNTFIGETDHVLQVLQEMKNIPRFSMLLKMFTLVADMMASLGEFGNDPSLQVYRL
ncbi:hypothetical protein BDR26DRAFT_936045 [Obelidium mucronatum]|nr:hypothetical protein BDR26DRAFT_936045 [Obelidium mucronatum]